MCILPSGIIPALQFLNSSGSDCKESDETVVRTWVRARSHLCVSEGPQGSSLDCFSTVFHNLPVRTRPHTICMGRNLLLDWAHAYRTDCPTNRGGYKCPGAVEPHPIRPFPRDADATSAPYWGKDLGFIAGACSIKGHAPSSLRAIGFKCPRKDDGNCAQDLLPRRYFPVDHLRETFASF